MDASGVAVGVACQAVVASEVAVAAVPQQRAVVALPLRLRAAVGPLDVVAGELPQRLPLQLQLGVAVAAAVAVGDGSESLRPDDTGCHDASVVVAAESDAAQRWMVAYRLCAVPSVVAAVRPDQPMK